MSRRTFATIALLCLLTAAGRTGAAEGIVTYKSLAPDVAAKLAQTTMQACRKLGYQVAVAVVDRGGLVQAIVRDRFAGAHTIETARRKAWSAVSFRTNTLDVVAAAKPGSELYGIHFVPGAMVLGGGVMIEAAGSLIGGIGVSGAVSGQIDEDCAKAGLETIDDLLNF